MSRPAIVDTMVAAMTQPKATRLADTTRLITDMGDEAIDLYEAGRILAASLKQVKVLLSAAQKKGGPQGYTTAMACQDKIAELKGQWTHIQGPDDDQWSPLAAYFAQADRAPARDWRYLAEEYLPRILEWRCDSLVDLEGAVKFGLPLSVSTRYQELHVHPVWFGGVETLPNLRFVRSDLVKAKKKLRIGAKQRPGDVIPIRE